jgi:polar amino acid transport system substrate-binding protein
VGGQTHHPAYMGRIVRIAFCKYFDTLVSPDRAAFLPADMRLSLRHQLLFWALHTSLVGLLALVFIVPVQAANPTLRISMAQGTVDEDVQALLQRAYADIGYNIELVDMPGARALAAAANGTTDGDAHRIVSIAAQYPTLVRVKVVIARHYHVALVRPAGPTFKVNGFESLRPYRIGVVRGYRSIENGTAGMSVEVVSSDESLLKMLALGRLDVAVTDVATAESLIPTLKLDTPITILNPPVEVIELYHYVNQRNAALVPALENALRRLLADKKGSK